MGFPLGKDITWGSHQGPLVVEVPDYQVIECIPCGFRHVVPLPSEEELLSYYETQFYQTSKPDYLTKASDEQGWLNIGYDTKLEMLWPCDRPRDEAQTRQSRPRILDVGSGPGFFLKRAAEQGWDAVGLEPSPEALDFSRDLGLNVIRGSLGRGPLPDMGRFDAIHLQHVLEHVPEPAYVLSILESLLAPGGRICVEVPNDFSITQEILFLNLGFKPWWVAPPEHLNYFSFDSLEALLRREGWHVDHRTTTFPIDFALLAGFQYVDNEDLGGQVHQARMNFESQLSPGSNRGKLSDLYSNLARLSFGREVILFAEKLTLSL